MKKVIFSLALSLLAVVSEGKAVAQTIEKGAKIEFAKETHDYGTVKYGDDGSCQFEFKNTGDEPLIISNAKGSCGCTVPEWPKEPIAPGAKGVIKVKYDTKRPGAINKSVTITSNAVNGSFDATTKTSTNILRIKGNVLPAPEGQAPVNNSGAPTNN
jgi:hypothetical protein